MNAEVVIEAKDASNASNASWEAHLSHRFRVGPGMHLDLARAQVRHALFISDVFLLTETDEGLSTVDCMVVGGV